MTMTHSFRTMLIGVAVCNPCAADETTAADGFRSELWRMEYREQDEQTGRNGKEPTEDDDASSVIEMDPSRQRVHEDDMVSEAVAQGSFRLSAPGQLNLQELNAQTPFADWKVDEGAEVSNIHQKFHRASAWQLSQVGNGNPDAVPISKGPSIVTLMVAIVACVVVTGALFSGRS